MRGSSTSPGASLTTGLGSFSTTILNLDRGLTLWVPMQRSQQQDRGTDRHPHLTGGLHAQFLGRAAGPSVLSETLPCPHQDPSGAGHRSPATTLKEWPMCSQTQEFAGE
jgi:hypothetical protein